MGIVYCIAFFTPFIFLIASECPWLTPFPQKVYVCAFGIIASEYNLFIEKSPGSQPADIRDIVLLSLFILLIFSIYSGIFLCVSKLSTVLYIFANCGTWFGKSFAEPPHIITTSIFFLYCSISSIFINGTAVCMFLREKIATNSISLLYFIASSTPFPKFPYPQIPIRIIKTS